jgi:hypothetical protein
LYDFFFYKIQPKNGINQVKATLRHINNKVFYSLFKVAQRKKPATAKKPQPDLSSHDLTLRDVRRLIMQLLSHGLQLRDVRPSTMREKQSHQERYGKHSQG